MTKKIVLTVDAFEEGVKDMADSFTHAGFLTRRALGNPEPCNVIDSDHLARQREWSNDTFGPGDRRCGVLDHIRKELVEIEDDPPGRSDEWFDVVILALDGAWRDGWEPQEIIDAITAKQAKNEARVWPDWRTADPDKAIEHDRSHDNPRPQAAEVAT